MTEATMRPIDTVDINLVKQAVKELNSGMMKDTKIKVVAVKKEVLVQAFVDAVIKLDADGKEGELSDLVIGAYNHIFTEPVPEEEKKKKEEKEKPKGNAPVRQTLRCATFSELEAKLAEPKTPTNEMDALFLKGGTLQELVDKFKASHVDAKMFVTKSQLRGHIDYRKNKSFWVFKEEGEKGNEFIQLIGVKGE
uniref:Uncharacterized protein n=1 Tax=viral metagenome TaxID=1070528 RepID=A0A6M3ISN9_9ZZZZ